MFDIAYYVSKNKKKQNIVTEVIPTRSLCTLIIYGKLVQIDKKQERSPKGMQKNRVTSSTDRLSRVSTQRNNKLHTLVKWNSRMMWNPLASVHPLLPL